MKSTGTRAEAQKIWGFFLTSLFLIPPPSRSSLTHFFSRLSRPWSMTSTTPVTRRRPAPRAAPLARTGMPSSAVWRSGSGRGRRSKMVIMMMGKDCHRMVRNTCQVEEEIPAPPAAAAAAGRTATNQIRRRRHQSKRAPTRQQRRRRLGAPEGRSRGYPRRGRRPRRSPLRRRSQDRTRSE